MGQVSAAQEKGFAARSSDMSGGVQRLIPALSKKCTELWLLDEDRCRVYGSFREQGRLSLPSQSPPSRRGSWQMKT